MKFYYLRCLNQDGQTERNGNFLDRKEAEKEKAALDLYPENKRYGIEQDIIEDSVMDIVKRRPDSNGVLPLTDKELEEFENRFNIRVTEISIDPQKDEVWNIRSSGMYGVKITNYKAILYLANLFELEVK